MDYGATPGLGMSPSAVARYEDEGVRGLSGFGLFLNRKIKGIGTEGQ
jgi:hypothetical protein